LLNPSTIYNRLKDFSQRLTQSERQVYEIVGEKICEQQISSNSLQEFLPFSLKNPFQKHQSSIKSGEQVLSNVNNPSNNKNKSLPTLIISSSENK